MNHKGAAKTNEQKTQASLTAVLIKVEKKEKKTTI